MSACTGCCFNFVEYIAVKKKNVLTNSEGKQTGFLAGIEPSTIGSVRLLLTTRSPRMITYSQTVLLGIDFPLILKLLVQIAYILSEKKSAIEMHRQKQFLKNSFFARADTILPGQR